MIGSDTLTGNSWGDVVVLSVAIVSWAAWCIAKMMKTGK